MDKKYTYILLILSFSFSLGRLPPPVVRGRRGGPRERSVRLRVRLLFPLRAARRVDEHGEDGDCSAPPRESRLRLRAALFDRGLRDPSRRALPLRHLRRVQEKKKRRGKKCGRIIKSARSVFSYLLFSLPLQTTCAHPARRAVAQC